MGVNFGGNGTSTFGIPDLRGRAPVHFGQVHYNGGATGFTYEFAQQFGLESETLTTANVPLLAHTHTITEKTANSTVTVTATAAATANASDAQGTLNKPQNTAYWAKGWNATNSSVVTNYTNSKNVTLASDAVTVTVTPTTTFTVSNLAIGASGAAATSPFALAQPSLALNFCICTAGLFPSRN